MAHIYVKLRYLIPIVKEGGCVKTGLNTSTRIGKVISDKDHIIETLDILEEIGQTGQTEIPVCTVEGYMRDKNGVKLLFEPFGEPADVLTPILEKAPPKMQERIKDITEIKRYTKEKFKKARGNIKKVIEEIKSSGGKFDEVLVEDTVTDIFNVTNEDESAFSLMTREIFTYDDYLYNHSINVCTIGCAVLLKYNRYLENLNKKATLTENEKLVIKKPYTEKEIKTISKGFFIHDIGKVLIPENILNKTGKLTEQEYMVIKTHSFHKGPIILSKNNTDDPFISNIVKNHHGEIYPNEKNCYPGIRYSDVPDYVKICKLADIYDSMTSKKCYKEATNPRLAIKCIYRDYNGKDQKLQTILHAFVGSIGIYPPGSFVYLMNGKLAFVLDSKGPLLMPFESGSDTVQEPFYVNENKKPELAIDDTKPKIDPESAYRSMPPYLKELIGI